jgi:hypothetical protein
MPKPKHHASIFVEVWEDRDAQDDTIQAYALVKEFPEYEAAKVVAVIDSKENKVTRVHMKLVGVYDIAREDMCALANEIVEDLKFSQVS